MVRIIFQFPPHVLGSLTLALIIAGVAGSLNVTLFAVTSSQNVSVPFLTLTT